MRFRQLVIMAGVLWAVVLAGASTASAVPRMSLTASTPCSACHVNIQGGGMRTDIGWGSMAYSGAYVPAVFEEQETNTFFDSMVAVGGDVRIQMARLGAPTVDPANPSEVLTPDRKVIPMQIQPYLSISPTESGWFKLYGTYAAGPELFRDGKLCDPIYNGQSCFEAQAIFHPSATAPHIRAGMLQPSIGIRHDDHTMLIRGDASAPRSPIIAPNYAEWGAELSYTPVYWFQTELGGFVARNLSEAVPVVQDNDVALLGRVLFQPRISKSLTSWIGTSLFWVNDFRMENYFLGLGWLDHGSLMLEASRTDQGDAADHTTLNMMAGVSVQFKQWLTAELRGERATTKAAGQDFTTHAAVIGAQFFPMPYVELRPEYRLIKTDSYSMGQYTVQLHLFY